MQNQSTNIYRLATLLLDGLLLVALFIAVAFWRFEDLRISNPEYYNYYLQLLVLTIVSWYSAGRWAGFFSYTSGLEQRNVTANLLRGAIAQLAILAIVVVGLKGYYYSRVFLVTYFVSLYSLALLYRFLLVQFLRIQMAQGKWQRRYLLSGQHATSDALISLTELRPELGWKYDGSLEDATLDRVYDIICAHAPGTEGYASANRLALEQGMRFRFLPDLGPQYAGQMFLESLEGIPMFSQRQEPLANWANAWLKRVFDVVLSFLVIISVLSWLFPLLGMLLLFSGAGNPWFIQEREGLQSRPFKVLKFKTMNHEGKSNALQSWMRKIGIDEIPQLLNVLLGQMSLVGPRPHTSGDGIAYSKMVQSYRVRYWTKPGLTGLAQTRGLRGGGDSARKELLELRIRADVYYIENWSLLLDLRILIETVLRTLLAPSSLHAK